MLYFSALLGMAVENRCHVIELAVENHCQVCLSWWNNVNSCIQYRIHAYSTCAFVCVYVCVFERLKLQMHVCVYLKAQSALSA